jgi:DNA repair exonuclease SbcCD ATPase subunit
VATDVAALAARYTAVRQDLDRTVGRAQQVVRAGKAVEAETGRLEQQVGLYAKAGALLTTIGEQAQESARAQFEGLATQALQVIFGEGLSFRFAAGESGGQATLEPVIRSEYGGTVTETPVMDARGGGMAAVTGFVLRLVMVLLSPGVRKILFLDETFGMVSQNHVADVAGFLREVADRTGVQIVMITHDPVYAEYADVKVRLVLGKDGMTQVFEGESE